MGEDGLFFERKFLVDFRLEDFFDFYFTNLS